MVTQTVDLGVEEIVLAEALVQVQVIKEGVIIEAAVEVEPMAGTVVDVPIIKQEGMCIQDIIIKMNGIACR
jgi:hypothetical protein